jgi:hypothetical protein
MIQPFLSTIAHLQLVGLTGPAGAGKDSVADHLCAHYGFVRAAFADPIRNMLAQLLEDVGVDHAVMTEQHLKEAPIPVLFDKSARNLMQTLGTEWGRTCIGPDVWVRVLETSTGLMAGVPVHDRIVVTDVRFANEAEMIKRYGGEMLAVRRCERHLLPASHISEAGVPAHLYEHVIDNSGTLGQLQMHVDGWCRSVGLDQREGIEP